MVKKHLTKYFTIGFVVVFFTDLLSNYIVLNVPLFNNITAVVIASVVGGAILALLDYFGVVG